MKIIDHEMTIIPIGQDSCLTAYSLYKVVCKTCDLVVHESTTAPDVRIREHLAKCMNCGQTSIRNPYGYQCGCNE